MGVSGCYRVLSFHFNGTQESSPHSSKQPHIFLKFAPFFPPRLVSYGEGEGRKCPINHPSVLTQLRGRKCREQSPYLFHFEYNKSYQDPLKGSPSDSSINSSRPLELFPGTRPKGGCQKPGRNSPCPCRGQPLPGLALGSGCNQLQSKGLHVHGMVVTLCRTKGILIPSPVFKEFTI